MELTKGGNAVIGEPRVELSILWAGALDVDVAALLLGSSGKVRSDADFIFYNQPHHYSGSVSYLGRSGGSRSTDNLEVHLDRVEASVDRIIIIASAGAKPLGSLGSLRLELKSQATGTPLLIFNARPTVETAQIIGEIYRRNGQWKMRAVDQGYDDGLRGIATDYGIDVDEEELEPAEQFIPAYTSITAPLPPPSGTPTALVPVSSDSSLGVPAYSVEADPVAMPVSDDAEVTLQPFATTNPYLRKLFTMKEFGRAPGRAIQIFRERIIDPDERMLAAFKSQHGRLRWGYVIMTTEYLRWLQTVPVRDEEMYEYADRIEVEGSMVRLPTGDQFQLKGFGAGRKFKTLFQVAQQAHLWRPS